MKLAVCFTPVAVNPGSIAGKPVLVIDILRATTSMIAALAHGAKAILPAASADDALKLAQNLERGSVLLAGERRSERIPGFALGNSPLEMTPDAVAGKTLVMTTTNGIPAILAADDGRPVLIGAAVNFRAAADAARRAFEAAGELTILCAGRDKGFALEDAYAAGRFVEAIVPGRLRRSLELNDAGVAARELVRKYGNDWKKAVTASAHARFLRERNFAKDVAFAAQADTHDLVPVYADRRVTA
ncbi:MAG: 2-phosphosulfolactate phosphatase [Gemmatimonadetes bacterium]|nr:2-phosphosulfolactate phosphatase [Gemmatimonadota bacterium]MBI2615492.1 2-phosphosulfolactate phosphatase [Gemmatimonadota bacterium]